MKSQIEHQEKALELERSLLENKIQEIESELELIPDQWLKQHRLELSSKMNLHMLDNMTRMVESKNIEDKLHQVQSKPIDLAYAPLRPLPPRLKVFALIGAFIGLILGLVLVLMLDFIRGFPLSLKNLQLQGRKVCGKGDSLQVLRALSAELIFPYS